MTRAVFIKKSSFRVLHVDYMRAIVYTLNTVYVLDARSVAIPS